MTTKALPRAPREVRLAAQPGVSAKMPSEKQPDTSTYSGRVSSRIREARKARRMTVEELRDALRAAGCQIALSTLYGWENGSKRPDPDDYPALAKVLGFKSVRQFLPSE